MYDIDEILFSFSEHLEDVIHEHGYTIAKLSRKMGIPYTTVWSWVTGQRWPTMEYVMKLANALDISIDELIGAKK